MTEKYTKSSSTHAPVLLQGGGWLGGDCHRSPHRHREGTTTRTTTAPQRRAGRRRGGRGRQHQTLTRQHLLQSSSSSVQQQEERLRTAAAGGPPRRPRGDQRINDDNKNKNDGDDVDDRGRDGDGGGGGGGSSIGSATLAVAAGTEEPRRRRRPPAFGGSRAATTTTKRPREEAGSRQFPKARAPLPTLLVESSSSALGTPVRAGGGGGRPGLSLWNTGGAAAATASSDPATDCHDDDDDAEVATSDRKRRKRGKRNYDDYNHNGEAWEEEGSHEQLLLFRQRVRQECAAYLPPAASNQPTPLQDRVWQAAFVVVGGDASSSSIRRLIITHHKDTATTVASTHARLRSCVVLGPTASGKTLAYGVPLLRWVQGGAAVEAAAASLPHSKNNRLPLFRGIGGDSACGALVAVPTRELALQVAADLERAVLRAVGGTTATGKAHGPTPPGPSPPPPTTTTPVAIVACYGGVDRTRQWESLLRAASSRGGGFVVVGTPGRLLDLLLDPKQPHPAGGGAPRSSDSDTVATGRQGGRGGRGGGAASAVPQQQHQAAHLRSSIVCAAIDEADRMGLQPDLVQQVNTLLESLHRVESLFLASATMPHRVQTQWDVWIRQTQTSAAAAASADTRCAVVRLESSSDSLSPSPSSSKDVRGGAGDLSAPAAGVAPAPAALARTDLTGSSATPADNNRAPVVTERVAGHDWRARIPAHVEQVVHVCADHKKPRKLFKTLQTLRDSGKKRKSMEKGWAQPSSSSCGIVFFNTVKRLRDVAHLLRKEKGHSLPAFGELHGRLDQAERERTLRCFRSGRIPVLLATDVAARGLHVDHAAFVVNYDFPSSLEQYVHRCGRVGRWRTDGETTTAGPVRSAVAYSYFPRRFAPLAPDLIRLLESCGQWVDPNLRELAAADATSTRPGQGRADDDDDGHDPPPGSDGGDVTAKGVRCRDKGQDDSDDEFGALSGLRIALRRASHVSDASSDDDDLEEEDNGGGE